MINCCLLEDVRSSALLFPPPAFFCVLRWIQFVLIEIQRVRDGKVFLFFLDKHCIESCEEPLHFLFKGWHRGESAQLPPMWPGFKSRRRRHMWVEIVVGSPLCSERFFSGHSGFPLSSKTNISKFQFDQESGRRRTTLWMCYLQIIIYFINLFK